jgi:L-asparaginase II
VSEAVVVEVRRNGVVEARHRVHAVAVRGGAVVAEAGDGSLTCFMRSASKPLQALPLARARADLEDADLAIASASHHATPEQIAAVRALLAKADATQDDLELGLQEGRPPERIFHNCSGKHAGMLALCRARGWATRGYRLPRHPVQEACRDAHAEAAEVEPDELPGLLCAAGPDGVGVALKTEDGAQRALRPALAAFLARLGVALPDSVAVVPVVDSRGDRVGEIVTSS